MTARRTLVLVTGFVAAWVPHVAAQDSAFVEVDRIVAVVGDTPIPRSRIDEELNILRQRGGEIPTDPIELARLTRQILDRVIDDELVIQAAERDTMIEVTEQDIQTAVDEAIGEIRAQFASELEYQRQLRTAGFATPEEYRRWQAEQKRREFLFSAMVQSLRERGELTPLQPTEAELRQFFEETKAQHPGRPATVTFRQIVVVALPDPAALARAAATADSLVRALRDGADFDAAAREHSDDVGTRDRGGQLGWVRRGRLVREFEAAAFALRPGVISNPVHTLFGFHIIEVQRSQPAEVQVRHILIAPELTDENRATARARADSVAEALRRGAPFDSLARIYHDRIEDMILENIPREDLPAVYGPITTAQPGQVLDPMELDRGDGRTKYVVILFQNARAEGAMTFDDLRDTLREQLAQLNALQRFIKSLRDATYIDIRM